MTHDEMIAVIAAHRDGKEIQWRRKGVCDNWLAIGPAYSGFNFAFDEYRVKPEKRVAYFNIYREHPRTSVYAVRRDADKGCSGAEQDRIACVRIEYCEGQYDE